MKEESIGSRSKMKNRVFQCFLVGLPKDLASFRVASIIKKYN